MRLKDVVTLVNEKTERTDLPYIALENIVSWDARFVVTGAVTDGTSACFSSGDVLFGKLRPYLAKGYIPDYDGICSTEFLVMRPLGSMSGRYLLYWLLSPSFIGEIRNQVSGVKMPRTDWPSVGAMENDFPPLCTQQRVVDYLDEKTAAIDGKVAVLEKKLAAYKRLKKSVINLAVTRGLDPNVKLKDSCVDWIGQVPERWKIKRFKDVLNYTTGVTPDSKNDAYFEVGGNNTWITIGDMNEKVVSTCSLSLSDRALVEFAPPTTTSGSLMFSFKLSIGKVAFAGKDLTTNEAIASVKPSGNYSLGYLYYYLPLALHANAGENIYGAEMLNQKIIRNMFMAFPFVVEQQAIADYLDEECAKIDRAAEIVTREIDAYKRLKRSLINEVVTGKRKVA